MTAGDIFLAVLALFFPPLAVWVKRGICSCDSLINILLCLLGVLPGLLHAWYIIAKYPEGYELVRGDADYEAAAGLGGHRVTYYYVTRSGGGAPVAAAAPLTGPGTGAPDGGKAQRQLQRGASYGAVSGEGSSQPQSQAQGQGQGQGQTQAPPTYAEAVKGDHKVQGP